MTPLQGGAGPDELDGGDDPDVVPRGTAGTTCSAARAATTPSKAARGPIGVAGGDGDDRLDGGDQRRVGADGGDALSGGLGDDVPRAVPATTCSPAVRAPTGSRAGRVTRTSFTSATPARRSPSPLTGSPMTDARTSMTTLAPTSRASAAAARTTRSEVVRCSRAATARTTSTGSAGADRLRGGAGGDTLRSRDDAARSSVLRAPVWISWLPDRLRPDRVRLRGGRSRSAASHAPAGMSPSSGRSAARSLLASPTGSVLRSAPPARTGSPCCLPARIDATRGSRRRVVTARSRAPSRLPPQAAPPSASTSGAGRRVLRWRASGAPTRRAACARAGRPGRSCGVCARAPADALRTSAPSAERRSAWRARMGDRGTRDGRPLQGSTRGNGSRFATSVQKESASFAFARATSTWARRSDEGRCSPRARHRSLAALAAVGAAPGAYGPPRSIWPARLGPRSASWPPSRARQNRLTVTRRGMRSIVFA